MMNRLKLWCIAALLTLYPCLLPSPAAAEATMEDKSRQKKTISDIRTVGVAMMSWLTDQVAGEASKAEAEDSEPVWSIRSADAAPDAKHPYYPVSYQQLTELLVPDYIEAVPETDGWGHPYEYALSSNLLASNVLGVRSPGRDGLFETDDYEVGAFDIGDADRDIVWCDGYFVRWPQGP